MSCHTRVDEWTPIIHAQLPLLSKPQATVLTLWSLGMVLARSGALTAVSVWLAPLLQRQEQTVRQQLREWCDEAEAKRGTHRQVLALVSIFRRGGIIMLVALLNQVPLPLGAFLPEPWPMGPVSPGGLMAHPTASHHNAAA